MQVGVKTGNIIEEDHYYAYGLKIAGISSKKLGDAFEGNLKNNYLYNGKEFFDDGDINWYDYGYRNYDPQIGRFMQLDPLTDDYPELTNYQYASCDPITNIDMDGLEGLNTVGKVKLASDGFYVGETGVEIACTPRSALIAAHKIPAAATISAKEVSSTAKKVSALEVILHGTLTMAGKGPQVGSNIDKTKVIHSVNLNSVKFRNKPAQPKERGSRIGSFMYGEAMDMKFQDGYPEAEPGSDVYDLRLLIPMVTGDEESTSIFDFFSKVKLKKIWEGIESLVKGIEKIVQTAPKKYEEPSDKTKPAFNADDKKIFLKIIILQYQKKQ